MVAHGTHLEGNDVVHLMTLGSAPYPDFRAGLLAAARQRCYVFPD